MKWIGIIMAFILLTLSVQPLCISNTQNNCCLEGKQDLADKQLIDKACHDSGKECPDSCNPFQLCDCCPFCVVVSTAITLTQFDYTSGIDLKWGMAPLQIHEEHVSGFWQPPKRNS